MLSCISRYFILSNKLKCGFIYIYIYANYKFLTNLISNTIINIRIVRYLHWSLKHLCVTIHYTDIDKTSWTCSGNTDYVQWMVESPKWGSHTFVCIIYRDFVWIFASFFSYFFKGEALYKLTCLLSPSLRVLV